MIVVAILNPLNEIVAKKPLVALAAIVLISVTMLIVSVLRPKVEGKTDRTWLPDDGTLAAIFKLLFQSFVKGD